MHDRIKKALEQVRAEEALKNDTKTFIEEKIKAYTHRKTSYSRYLIPVLACFLFVVFGGAWFYFTPAVAISIDINPSIELGINRFDKVISVTGYTSDGEELADSLDIKYLDYTEAVSQILSSQMVSSLLSSNGVLSIGVIGPDNAQSARMLSKLESCTAGKTNTYCYHADMQQVNKAHEMGLSYGKYRAYLELQALDPSITPQIVQQMTMREIQDLINALSPDNTADPNLENQNGSDGYTTGSESGHGHANRYGASSTVNPSCYATKGNF